MLLRNHFRCSCVSILLACAHLIYFETLKKFFESFKFFLKVSNIFLQLAKYNAIRQRYKLDTQEPHKWLTATCREGYERQKKDDKTEKWQEKRVTRRKGSHRLVNLIVRPQSHAQPWGRFLLFLSLFPCNDKIFNYQLSIVNYNSYLCTQYYI